MGTKLELERAADRLEHDSILREDDMRAVLTEYHKRGRVLNDIAEQVADFADRNNGDDHDAMAALSDLTNLLYEEGYEDG